MRVRAGARVLAHGVVHERDGAVSRLRSGVHDEQGDGRWPEPLSQIAGRVSKSSPPGEVDSRYIASSMLRRSPDEADWGSYPMPPDEGQ